MKFATAPKSYEPENTRGLSSFTHDGSPVCYDTGFAAYVGYVGVGNCAWTCVSTVAGKVYIYYYMPETA